MSNLPPEEMTAHDGYVVGLEPRCPTCGGTKEEPWCYYGFISGPNHPLGEDPWHTPCTDTFHDTTGER